VLYGIDILRKICNHPHLVVPVEMRNLHNNPHKEDYGMEGRGSGDPL
jgi:hypothetical protein